MFYYAHHCGGDRHARDQFKDHPYYQDTVDFCEHYDQNCFDPDYDSLPLEFFAPMLTRVFSKPAMADPEQQARYGTATEVSTATLASTQSLGAGNSHADSRA